MTDQALALSAVRPDPNNHRETSGLTPESIAELGEKIRQEGQLMPVCVRPDPSDGPGVYRLVWGHRRYYALLKIGAETINAEVREGLTEVQVADLQASENFDRVNPAPCEEAAGYRRQIDARREEKPWLSEADALKQVATKMGKSVPFLRDRLRLLLLPIEVRQWVGEGFVGVSHALQLVRLVEADEKHEAELMRLALKVKAKDLTADDVKQRVTAYLGEQAQYALFEQAQDPPEVRKARNKAANIGAALERLAENTFDRRGQVVSLGGLRRDELATFEAGLVGGIRHAQAVLAEVQSALGKQPDLPRPQPVERAVPPRPIEARQDAPEVVVAQGAVPEPEAPRNAPETPAKRLREAVLVKPKAVEFGGEVRVSVVGTWLWVFGPAGTEGGGSSLSWALHRAGARWASGRQAWYAVTPEEHERVQAVLREHLSDAEAQQPTGAECLAQAAG